MMKKNHPTKTIINTGKIKKALAVTIRQFNDWVLDISQF